MNRSRFLITGLPRSRTAWIAALFCAHEIETIHEYPVFFKTIEQLGDWLHAGTEESPHGYVDGFSIIHHAELARQTFFDNPIVVIQRNPADVRASWEKWSGPIIDEQFSEVMRKVKTFCDQMAPYSNCLIVNYDALDDYESVNKMVVHCTGRPLKQITWQLFHHLKIELHREKVSQLGFAEVLRT